MPIYKVNGDVYNIPKEKAGAFEERYPNASVSYSSDGDKYDIPLSKKAAFMNRYPKATLYSEEDKNDDLPNEMVVDSSSLSPSPSPTVESNNKTSPVLSPSSRFVKGKGKDTTIFGVPYNVYTHMKPETQSYYHQKALDDEKRNLANNVSQQAGEVQMQAEDAYDRRYNKLEAEEQQFREEHPFLSFIKDLANAGRPVPIPPTMEDKDTELRTLQGVVENARTTKQTIDESGERGNTTFFGGLGRGMRDMAGRGSTWDMGVLDLNRNFAISTAANKYLKGEELDDTEKILLRSAAIEHVANNEFAGDFGRGYKMGQTTVQSLPFMAEFLINPLSGSGKAIGKGMLRQGLKVVGKELPAGMLGKVVNGTTRIMGDVTAASGMALTTGSARTTADFVDRQNGAADYEVDNDGNIQYSGQEGGVGLGEAAYKAIASQTIENFSEMAGGYFNAIGKGVGNLVGKAMEKSSLLNRLGNTVSTSKVADLYRNISSSQLAKTITDFERNTGYHGTIEEYGEEVAGTVLNAIFTGDQSFSDLGDIDQQIDTFLGVCGIGGLFSTIKAVGYRTPVHQANRELGKIGKQLSHSMGDEWNDVSQALQDASVEDRKQYLTNIIERDDISDETKLGLFQYVGTLTRRDAIKSGKVKQVSEGEEQAENVIVDDEAEENYEAGYNAVNPQERNEAKLLLEQSASEVQHLFGLDKAEDVESVVSDLGESPAKVLMSMNEKGYSQDEISVISSFLNAKETYNGVIDNVKDGIDNEIATQIDYIDKNTHQDGSLYNATMKVDDRNVYVTGGNVVLDEENNIDHEKSDTSIVIRDASTGKVEMVDVRDIFSVKTGVNAEQHKAEITEQIRQDYAQRAANEINGVLSFAPGDVYDVINPATGQLSAINVVQDNGDGTVIISDESGTQAQSTKDEIQAMAEQANIAKMNEHRLSQQPSKYALNNEVIIPTREGPVRGFVTAEKDADGLIEVMTESPINGKKVNVFTEEELKQLTNDVSLADNVESSDILSEQEVQEPVATVQVEPGSAMASEIQPVEEQSIPVDDKGNMLYHKAPVELTIADLNDGNLTTDEVDAFVIVNKEEATRQLKKISEKPPKVGTNKAKYLEEKKKWNDAVADINSQVAYWKEVEAQLQAIREQPGDTTASEIKAMGEPLNGSELAAIMLGAGKLPLLYNDYKRETGFGNSDARGMFGMFSTKENGGMTIEQAGEQLMLADLEAGTNFFDQNDPNEGRNAIIDVLSSARTRSGLINYIKSNREAMAERERQAEAEADELAKEQWYQDYYHMTPEEYELWNQGELFAESNMISDEDHQELMSSFTDEILKEQENDRRISQESGSSIAESESNEQGRISGVRESGGSVLQGEESVPTGRTGGIEEESGQIDANSGAEYDALQGSTSGGELTSSSRSQENVPDTYIPSMMEGESLLDYASRVNEAHTLHKEEQKVDTNPTDAQKEAGNYKKGHIKVDGFDITIENPRGSERSGVGADGKSWSVTMNNTYGYIRGTEGVDGDHIDVFLGDSGNVVYVVDQVKEDGSFDEHKVMYGFGSVDEAKEAYLSNYSPGWKGLGNITGVSKEAFREWIDSSHRKIKPFNEYKSVRGVVQSEVAQSAEQTEALVTSNESETKDAGVFTVEDVDVIRNNPLTVGEIESSAVEPELKTLAKDYLAGNESFINLVAYQNIYNDVRNRTRGFEPNSTGTGETQLDEVVNGNQGGLESGFGRGEADNVGAGRSETPVSGSRRSGKTGTEQPTLFDGERGDHEVRGEEPAVDGVSPGRGYSDGGGRAGGNGRDVSRPTRGKTGSRGTKNDTGRRTNAGHERVDSVDKVDRDLQSALDDFKDILNQFGKAGKNDMSLSLVGLNKEQIQLLPRLVSSGVKLGYQLIKKEVYDFKRWAEQMRSLIGDPLKQAIGYGDTDVNAFIQEMWNSKFEMDGEVHTLAEWSAKLGTKELKKQVSATLEEKRAQQMAAESIPVRIADAQNIDETLPYLLPQQREDVRLAEVQFFDESHQDREHGNGKGYLFTNGTGTGKTYTGLGIVKRFIKQGKNRILVVTPSQPKVTDWIKDAGNLGIELRDLDTLSKEKGTTATTEKGEGAVITTFANLRQNKALLEDTFDLIVYDESHRIMENKQGEATIGADVHFMITNRNADDALRRYSVINPKYQAWQKAQEVYNKEMESFRLLMQHAGDNEIGAKGEEYERRLEDAKAAIQSTEKEWREEEKPLKLLVGDAVKTTKTVFLSATPFNTRESLTYTEGYIFSFPEENTNTVGSYHHHSPQTEFYLTHFGAGYKFRYGRLERGLTNADALVKQEVAFSDYLENELGTKSGRIIDSEYDYSRDFPMVTLKRAQDINDAIEGVWREDALNPLSDALRQVWFNYNYTSALLETMKISATIPRIREHLKMGRKVVIFHRRVQSKAALNPPFKTMLSIAREQMRSESDAEEKKKLRDAIALFEKRHEGLLQYEQTLNYSMPREQIAEAFGEENVLFFSGQESGKTKNKAVEVFNDDDSGKNIIVIQEASGKEGISLHDTSGKHQRVIITLALPQSPITALQIEGRIYRIGNKSNAIFEYPLLGLDSEMILFGQQFNQQVSTTENLALGSKARDLRSSFTRGVEEHTNVPLEQQGLGGKEFDKGKLEMADPYEDAVLDYYGNQKVKGRRDNREGMDYFATPEPVGFKMVEWAMPQEGESALEPSAGHGAIARYVSHDVSLTAIEPSNSLFGKLQLRAGGMGRKFVNDLFENYAFQNKHDVIVMNPPFGTAGKKAMDHLEKAFDHLTEGGRVVALIPRGQMDKRFEKWYGEKKEAVVTAEINLPSCTFEQAGTSVYARVVVIDRIGREETRRKAPYRRNIDLSGIKTVKELFERLKDVEVPGRTIDEVARNMKNAKKTIKEFKEIKGVDVIVDTDGIYAYGRSGMTLFSQKFDSESMANIPNEYARMHYWIEANGTADMGNRAKEQIEVYFTGMKTLRNLTGKTHELLMKESEGGKNILPAENTKGTGVVSEQQRSGDKYSYKEDRNTKTGEVMHLAIPLSKDLDRELYLQMVSCAKRNDGYWNRFKKAFHFQTKEGADAFIRESVTIGEGGNVRFRLPDSEGGNGNPAVEQGEIKAEVEELADTLHTPIRIVRDTDEISDSNKGLEQRKKQSKGWFDSETSEVVLVLPNAKSVEDAMATVLHEIVGHSGLRAVFGNKFDEFIERVFHGANQSTRQKIVELAAKNNWNFHLATEEYLARLAEKGFESNRGFWTKVRSIFMNIIHEAKLRLGFRISDNDLRYALWRTYQLQTEGKGGIQEADNIDMQQRLRVGNFSKRNSWLLFRDGPVTEGKVEKTMARYLYESQTRKRSYKFKEAYQDSMLGLKKFMEAVSTATGEDIADHENAYMAENQMSSRSTYETEFYKDNFFTPMMKAVAALINKGFDYNEIVDYMVAKHGIERNRELSVRDAILSDYKDEPEEIKRLMNEYHEQRDKVMELFKNGIIKKEDIEDKLNEVAFLYTSRISDYSGLSSLTGEEEEYENAARTLVSDMEEDNLKETQVLWDKVNAATKETLRKNYDSGMITKETYEKVSSMFMNYIPLRGWKEDTAADVYSYLISERSIFNAPVKAAVGRKSLADDPLATIGNMAESAILQGNRNLMKQKFLNLVINHPTELATVKEMWYVLNESTDEWEQSLPNIPDDATPEEVQNVIDEHERRMLELIRDKRAKKGRLDVPYKTLPPERKEHTVIVRRNGKEFTIFINGNPRVAQAVNGLTNPDATSHRFMQWVGRLNRQMSANFTTRNPAFVLSNLSRDLIFSSTAIAVKENRKYSARFMKNIAANLKDMCGLMQRHERGTLNLNNPKDKYFHEFLQYGGETGYTNLHSVDEYKKLVDRQIMDAQGKVDIGRIFGLKSDKFTTTTTLGIVPAFQFVAKWTEFCNRCAEDTSRFATYMTSREMGRSVLRSISDAKEVTVNFNKKGAGGYGATTFKNLYLFFNAAVQSLQNFGGLAKKNPKKFAVALSSFTAAGILLPMLNQMLISMFGDDDDKDAYNNLPEWVRKNNLCFWTGGKKFVTIPLPIELRAFYGTGEIFHSLMNGDNVGRNWGMALVGQFAELLPINPLGNEDAISTIVPDAGKPLYQAMINKDYFGSPIYKDSDYNKLMPEWTKAYTGTSKALVSSTDLLNELTGGDKYTRGWLNANPALIEHYFESYFGGMGKTINQLGKTISMIWDEDERIMRNIPVANRFLSNENERNAFSRVNEEYYYFLEEFKETGQRLRGYEKEANKGILEYAEKEDFLYNSPKYERYEIMKDYQKDIMGIREEIKEIEDELTRKDLELLLNLTKMELVDELRSVK